MHDVLIVGASVAGASLAMGLSGSGLDVIVVDNRAEDAEKCCGAGLTWRCDDIGWFAKEKRSFVELTSLDHHFMFEENAHDYVMRGIPIYQTRRRTLDDHLRKLASASGAKMLREKFASYRILDDRIEITTDKCTHEARMIAGCDGAHSAVRKAAEKRNPMLVHKCAMGYAAMTEVPTGKAFTDTYWLINRERTGYCWAFPKSDRAYVGVARMKPGGSTKVKDELAGFLKRMAQSGLLCEVPDDAVERLAYAPLPICGPLPIMHDERLILAGDASYAVCPFWGEGISYAFKQSLLATKVILECRDFSAKELSRYTGLCKGAFGNALARRVRMRESGRLYSILDFISNHPRVTKFFLPIVKQIIKTGA